MGMSGVRRPGSKSAALKMPMTPGMAGGLVTRTREAQRRPVHLDPAALESVTAWIDNYRLQAERSYRRLEAVLGRLKEHQAPAVKGPGQEGRSR